jgi:hypothetical protein
MREDTVSLSNPPLLRVYGEAGMETKLREKPRLIHGETCLQIVSRVHDFNSWFIEREGVLYTIRQLTPAGSVRQSTQGVGYDPSRSARIGLSKNTTTI